MIHRGAGIRPDYPEKGEQRFYRCPDACPADRRITSARPVGISNRLERVGGIRQ